MPAITLLESSLQVTKCVCSIKQCCPMEKTGLVGMLDMEASFFCH